jgi:hypothetical protein
MIRVEDTEGRPVGTEVLQPGHDPLSVARKILREKRGKNFYAAIAYPNRRVV